MYVNMSQSQNIMSLAFSPYVVCIITITPPSYAIDGLMAERVGS